MNERTDAIYNFIEQYIRANMLPPTVREIRQELAISSNSVVLYHLRLLEANKRIMRLPNTARGIRLVNGRE